MTARQFSGQSSMEYALFAAVVAAALVAMTLYVRRAILAHVKALETEVSPGPMM